MSDDLSGFSLIDLFRLEAEGQTAILSEGLLALEAGTGSAAVYESLMRAAHSLKGAARIVDIEPAVKIAHRLEDCFVAAQRAKINIVQAHVDVLLRGVDLLARISQLEESEYQAWLVEHDPQIQGFEADLARVMDPSNATVPEPEAAVQPVATSSPNGIESLEKIVLTDPSIPAAPTPDQPDAELEPASSAQPSTLPAPRSTPQPVEKIDAEADRVVRVSASSLSRLTGLAGESLVQSRRLGPLLNKLDGFRRRQSRLVALIRAVDQRQGSADPVTKDLLAQVSQHADICLQDIGDHADSFEEFARSNEDLSTRLHHEILSSRMRPLGEGVRGFPRMVRDVSRQLEKQVQLVVDGEATGVDRDILDQLEAPLNHLIRNAIDHAIELPAERRALGKAETGTITLEARHRAGMLQIVVRDDGKGIDIAKLRKKVVERRLLLPTAAERLDDSELLEFLFLPGFSTRDAVTEVSGRGVGLDVVSTMARAVGGTVRVSTKLGQGTRFTLELPITMSVIRALLVEIAGEPYAFPLNRIDRIVRLPATELRVLEGRQHFQLDAEGEAVGIVSASQVLELANQSEATETHSVVVVSDRTHRFGVVVDKFMGERDLEVRPIDPRLGKVPNFNSASLLDDGWPVLIFDIDDLVRTIDHMCSGRRLKRLGSAIADGTETRSRTRRVLVVEDSITVRELERQILETHGYEVDTAIDGVDGWNQVRSRDYQLVISDVDMPRMDGFELVALIKQDPRLRTIPVVIVSYKEQEEHRMRGLDAGANAYLTKSSFRDQTFLATVVNLIGEA